ncbi:LLM class flavin-dependent oxidoreductase [Amycolatopsis thermophila]|uniref:Alkanesulfonate monooxygenase SsuD/methylene tetrahydromethanopterin reductase-like flavin-dependent oxidoreductase (Luciferase family) n=1 Tax=Amycolatopsis thermophila TaxID=206084 RepID=A0ABU0EUP5_9PSEU|nr:LLM class flavin-dependent oxidoreductase [Amycolatopsis thermophila]MDQ0379002.1 alkanesulfonate monooxygenase SsuD/methylene tetrahydromethanopterin reductase-like flavin-dependent oxidoreductase (luciferase family) [Amycolatopsis thermophila]
MTDKPFRFGVVAGPAGTLEDWTGLARHTEGLGYDTFLSPDPQAGLDPFTLLSAAAAATTTLHVGTFVAVSKLRDKRLLAWQAESLHKITGGRFELGLGTGRPDAAGPLARLGIEFGTPGERFAQISDTVDHLKTHADRPKLLLAAGGPKMMALAGREADIVTMAWWPRATEDEARDMVRPVREAAGDRDVELAMNLLAVGDEPAPWLEKYIGTTVAELAAGGSVSVLPGTPQQAADTLLRRRETLGISYITINSGYADRFARVVELLKGR